MAVEARRKIREWLAAKREDETRFLAELVRVPSDNPPGDCAPHAVRAAALLEGLGFKVEQHAVPDALVRANGMVSCTNLVVRERFGTDGPTGNNGPTRNNGPTVACNAHGDVVAPGLGWTTDPYGAEIRDGVMFGRGVAVSKSDFATYAFALAALKACGAKLNGAVELHFTYDEEAGGAIGPQWLLKQGISKPDYAISAGFSYGITTAHNGALHLEVEVIGKSAHAARPDTGDDAMEAANGIQADLYGLRRGYRAMKSKVEGIASPTLVIGLIQGGINTNVVPDNVKFRIDRRIIPDENAEEVERELIAQIKESAVKWLGIRCEVRRILLAHPFVPMPGQKRLVDLIRANACEILGEDIKPQGVPIYTDARHYSATGVPTVLYGAGPRTLTEANGHRADENLRLDDLFKATEIVALTFLDLLGAEQ